ncbi:ester cyclase [Galbitalea soli]|uniref:Ester cyclase n=1 Tax=Galbitalea soli TaxID=1268042 RepID=A0A7C9TQZ1_9MICO|nr:ester cyclase [Galbitalea soli]NEM91100.1 ester cyclase [Galbitalea soli]NYJ29788.1 steroid delta-isomerase-like uncharacterized protein [Galbitalea soli]
MTALRDTATRLSDQFLAALNQNDVAGMSQIVAPGYVQHNPEVPGGREGLLSWMASMHIAFPDFMVERLDMIVDADRLVVRHRVSGTHLGEFLGWPGSGRSFVMHTAEFFRIADGVLQEHWDVWSPQGMLVQLGLPVEGGLFTTFG